MYVPFAPKPGIFGIFGRMESAQDLSRSWCMEETDESITRMDSSVPLMHHDLDSSWIADHDPDHPKGMHPLLINSGLKDIAISPCIIQDNLFYLTEQNKFIIGGEIAGKKGQR